MVTLPKDKIKFSWQQVAPWSAAAAFLGIMIVVLVSAAGTPIAFEAESGQLAAGATTTSVTGQSGSGVVKFGAAATPTPTPTPTGSLTCNLNATTANFAAQVTAATAGQTICLASGDYGTWTGTNKAITITKQTGATPLMNIDFGNGDAGFTIDGMSGMGGIMAGTVKNITIRNSTFTSVIVMNDLSNANVLLDHNTHNNISNVNCQGYAGRISINGNVPPGITISNSLLQGGNLDGVRPDAPGGVIIEGNQFIDIKENGPNDCQHTDSIQFYGGQNITIRNNYFRGGSDGIVAFDGTSGNQITGNVCVNLARGACITLYSDKNSVVEHNATVTNMDVLEIDHKAADPAGTGTIYRNNVGGLGAGNGSTVSVNTNNLYSGATGSNVNGNPVFVGGSSPTSWDGFKLAPGSPGKGAATDGLDIGIN